MSSYAERYREHLESTERKILDDLEKLIRSWADTPTIDVREMTISELFYGELGSEQFSDYIEDLHRFIQRWRKEIVP